MLQGRVSTHCVKKWKHWFFLREIYKYFQESRMHRHDSTGRPWPRYLHRTVVVWPSNPFMHLTDIDAAADMALNQVAVYPPALAVVAQLLDTTWKICGCGGGCGGCGGCGCCYYTDSILLLLLGCLYVRKDRHKPRDFSNLPFGGWLSTRCSKYTCQPDDRS
eukprot:COSAG02_NODE_1347_length_13138_cov_45.052535_2_plen_162_part_00